MGVIGGLLAMGIIGLFIGPVVLAVGYTLLDAWTAKMTNRRPLWRNRQGAVTIHSSSMQRAAPGRLFVYYRPMQVRLAKRNRTIEMPLSGVSRISGICQQGNMDGCYKGELIYANVRLRLMTNRTNGIGRGV